MKCLQKACKNCAPWTVCKGLYWLFDWFKTFIAFATC